jgi:plasmid stabilization system protein ParE
MASIEWQERALEDLRSIERYIQRDSLVYAMRVVDDIVAATGRLETAPRSGGIVVEIGDPSIREIYCHSYRVIYVVEADKCRVYAVMHGSRDLLQHLNPNDLLNP